MSQSEEAISPRDLLDSLGGNPDCVARRLEAEECFGLPNLPGGCPLATFLESKGFRRICCCHNAILCTGPDGAKWEIDELPPAIRLFMQLFDSGRYPALNSFARGEYECV